MIAIAGIAFFMLGMSMASEALEKLASNRIRDVLAHLSKRPHLGVFFGVLLTAALQSSGAVTTMLVGLGAANVVSLSQVMSLILGCTVGTTITVQIISFNIAQYGLPIFSCAFFVYFLTNKRALRYTMSALMGFGLIFFGMEMIAAGTDEMRKVEIFNSMLTNLKEAPFLAMMLTAFFTAIVHSSAVTIGIAMSLTAAGLIHLSDSVYWIFGANIGTTATALIASIGGNYIGRQVAWAHCFYKVVGVAIFYPLAPYMMEWISTGSVERDIANFHTIYNILAALVFFPGIKKGADLIEKLVPPKEHEKEFGVEYLNKSDWQSPAVALAHAEREVLRMGDIVLSMVQDSINIFKKDDHDLIADIRKRDDRVDKLHREINLFLARQNQWTGSELQMSVMRIMSFCADLESAADVIDNQMLDLASKKHTLKANFSESGWKDLEEIHKAVLQICSLSLTCFQNKDSEIAQRVIFHKRNTRKLEKRMREAHMGRLVEGRPESIATSSIHLDVLGEYRRVAGLMSNHCYPLVKDVESFQVVPRHE